MSLEKEEQESSVLFLRGALGVLVDRLPSDRIRQILETEMFFFKERREEDERVLRTAANLAPAFGLVGTVVGMISMLRDGADPDVIMVVVPIALTSTLYGVILANFFFTPFAVKLQTRTRSELLLQQIITEAILLIDAELPPRILERQLKAFLTPSQRSQDLVTYPQLIERFVDPGSALKERERMYRAGREQNGEPPTADAHPASDTEPRPSTRAEMPPSPPPA